MNVYLVYNNSESVDAIFDTERKALDFVIAEYYSVPYYQNMNSTSLDNLARKDVVEMKVH
jgi:hypothetical protein